MWIRELSLLLLKHLLSKGRGVDMREYKVEGNDSAILSEYGEIREEIRTYLAGRDRNRKYVYTIALGIAGIESSTDLMLEWPVYLVATLLVAFFWFDETRRIKAVYRAGTYIQVFIESKLPHLGWEKRGQDSPIQRSVTGRAIANGDYVLLYAGLSAYAVKKQLTTNGLSHDLLIPVIVVLSLVFLSLAATSTVTFLTGRRSFLEGWERKFAVENSNVNTQ